MENNFIGVYENAIDDATCDMFVTHFEKLNALNLVFGRPNLGTEIKDKQIEILQPKTVELFSNNPIFLNFVDSLWGCYKRYVETYDVLNLCGPVDIKAIKLQRTDRSCGYHVWHFENSSNPYRNRLLVWMLYLNDVEEGGETEFLYLNKRIKPKKGTILIWPAGFTHTHRGNPPLAGSKYIATSWIEHAS